LPSQQIRWIEIEKTNSFWLGCTEGLANWNPETNQITTYDKSDGMVTDGFLEYNASLIFEGSNILAEAGIDGIHQIDVKALQKNLISPATNITQVVVLDQEGKKLNYEFNRRNIVLPHNHNNIIITFSTPTWIHRQATGFKYRINNQNWINNGKSREVTLAGLAPGNYLFEVSTNLRSSTVEPSTHQFNITIRPPLWLTPWAYILYLLAFAGLIRYWFLQKNKRFTAEEKIRQLKEIEKFRTRVISNITHELKTPLTVILGLTEKSTLKPEKIRELHTIIRHNAKKLLQYINQMLELSRAQFGQIQLHPVEVLIHSFANQCVASQAIIAEKKGVDLHLNIDAQAEIVKFDTHVIQQILDNLISNAIKATPKGGSILVKVSVTDSLLQLEVTDNGIGIQPDQIPFLFDRFYKGNEQMEGSGIGLALVKELIGVLEGAIKVTSEPNVETTFTATIPVKVISKKTETKPQSDPNQSEKQVLLLIEDNPDIITFLELVLEPDYTLITAQSGEAGLQAAREFLPDLIISDVLMPNGDGLMVCKTLKSNPHTNHIPIILLTAKTSSQDKIEGLESGADAYLNKPVQLSELTATLQNLSKRRKFATVAIDQGSYRTDQPENEFLQKVKATILANISDESFGVSELSACLFLSRTQLFRKIKTLTNLSAAAYLQKIRINKAIELVESTHLTVSEIAYETGFSDPGYLRKIFLKETGFTINNYLKNKNNRIESVDFTKHAT
jgi:signal transduction histidine kinase/DNA-binding response OmpR family regulator